MPSYERVTCATVTGSTHRDTTLRQRLRQLGQKLASRFSTNVYLPKRATLRGKKAYSTACANMKTEKQHIMANLGKAGPSTHLVIESDCETLDVFGPSVQFLVAPQGSDEAPCVIKGTIPPGGSVPIHSHQAIEVFYVLPETLRCSARRTETLTGSPLDPEISSKSQAARSMDSEIDRNIRSSS
jgi:hypothetical protein